MIDQSRMWLVAGISSGVLLTVGLQTFYPYIVNRICGQDLTQDDECDLFYENQAYDLGGKQHRRLRRKGGDLAVSTRIVEGIEGTIGQTPLIKLKWLSEATGCEILGKAEFLNGAGNSPKDRVALSIINDAEQRGLLRPHSGDAIYEGTVGSTGISLAAIARARGYIAHVCMPTDVAPEKPDLLLKLGAKVHKTPPNPIVSPDHFVNLARRLAREHTDDLDRPGRGFFADQFENEANWRAHYETTGPELNKQVDGRLDAFVAGAGTGGTVTGVAKYLKGFSKPFKDPYFHDGGNQTSRTEPKVVIADPQGSGLYNKIKHNVFFSPTEREGTRRRHQVDSVVEGIGLTRSTSNIAVALVAGLLDDAVHVTDEAAKRMARLLVEREGIFVGSSSAVNCTAATKIALQMGPGHRIVTVLCDSGTRHLSKFWAQAGNIGKETDMELKDVLDGL
ncbi:MAG: hypothetical protein M1831_000932 [Alyxoria varia]|nr:MAG: hypothetical protein M1831_000932 [Alyxoria varia]